jgi:hypothetical protein
MCEEITVDKCVITHCDSAGVDAPRYKRSSLAFVEYFRTNTAIVVCVNAGIAREYSTFTQFGKTWWASVTNQSRFREKGRKIKPAKRDEFRTRQRVPLHDSDFDYVDAASRSNSLLWLSNETNWQNAANRKRIKSHFGVIVLDINEYVADVVAPPSDSKKGPA